MGGAVICLANNKGGIGKTSVTCHLACALGRKGKKVLVVDNDPQSNASGILLPKRALVYHTLYEIYDSGGKPPRTASCVYTTEYPGVDVIPNVEQTSGLLLNLAGGYPESLATLRRRVRPLAVKDYDVTLVDCPPTVCLFTANALFASDWALVPVDAGSSHSLDGLKKVLDLVESIQDAGNTGLSLLRLLVNRMDARTVISRTIAGEVIRRFGEDMVFSSRIPRLTAFEQADHAKETIFLRQGKSPGARAYEALAAELLAALERDKKQKKQNRKQENTP
ncbi:MAG: ParA family protein [Proteobacteria bacterium]|nr:ParA family protein [Pseudomonadota bacterium]